MVYRGFVGGESRFFRSRDCSRAAGGHRNEVAQKVPRSEEAGAIAERRKARRQLAAGLPKIKILFFLRNIVE